MTLDTPQKRLVLIGLLLLILVFLGIYYYWEHENHLEYPSYGAILSSYPLGGLVNVYGTVTEVRPGGFSVEDIYHDQKVRFSVESDMAVAVGDKVEIVGVLGPGNSITSVHRIIVSEKWMYQFLLLRSFLALLFLLYIFNRYWKWDARRWEFRRR